MSTDLTRAVKLPERTSQEDVVDCAAPLLLFAESSELARDGYYQDAEMLARQALCHPSGIRPALWNLLAKIYAQQGRYIDAESCWREALALAPGTPEYLEGLRTIAPRGQRRPVAAGAKWLVTVFVCAVFGYVGMAVHQHLQGHPAARATEASQDHMGETAKPP